MLVISGQGQQRGLAIAATANGGRDMRQRVISVISDASANVRLAPMATA
jgi:hypothetical protein